MNGKIRLTYLPANRVWVFVMGANQLFQLENEPAMFTTKAAADAAARRKGLTGPGGV